MRLYSLKGGKVCGCSGGVVRKYNHSSSKNQLTVKQGQASGGALLLSESLGSSGGALLLSNQLGNGLPKNSKYGAGTIQTVKQTSGALPVPNTEELQKKLSKLSASRFTGKGRKYITL